MSDNNRSNTPPFHDTDSDAHGQAALLLTESILHGLLEAGVFTFEQTASVVQTALEVKIDYAEETDESSARMLQSLSLLEAIGRTLAIDRPDDGNHVGALP